MRLDLRWLGVVLVVAGCGDEESPAPERPRAASGEASDADEVTEAIMVADRRGAPDRLVELASDPEPEVRVAAVRGLARLHRAAVLPALKTALRDPSAEVRDAAALGIGALEQGAGEEGEAALLAALATERGVEARATLLFDLGRVASDASDPAFRQALVDRAAPVRRGACRGLGNTGIRGAALADPIVRLVASRARDDESPDVRLACAFALTRLPAPPPGSPAHQALVEDLTTAVRDPDARVRAMATRALGRVAPADPQPLLDRALDPDPAVAIQALRALARGEGPSFEAALARALRERLDRALAEPSLEGPELHALLAGLEAALPRARTAAVFGVANEAVTRLAEPRAGEPLSRDRGLAHCAAARLSDAGRGWPAQVDECGLEQVLPPERQMLAAEVIAVGEGADAERLAYLQRLYRSRDARVRQAAVRAATSIHAPEVGELVRAALAAEDTGVVISACDAVVELAAVLAPADAPVVSVRPAGAPLPDETAPLRRALRRARRTLEGDLEGLQSWLAAVKATRDPSFERAVRQLSRHGNEAVRQRAGEVATALRLDLAEAPIVEAPNPIDPQALSAAAGVERAVVRTNRGEVVLRLAGAEAPTTVARFVALAREGFFDGLTFHRVVPGFVVQGGDPRGDGYGGPGWSQRCEDNRTPYERGTVGMALAGRDTGGSQFFFTISDQPHLDARYTAFARVEEGMDVVDRLQVGDVIRNVRFPR